MRTIVRCCLFAAMSGWCLTALAQTSEPLTPEELVRRFTNQNPSPLQGSQSESSPNAPQTESAQAPVVSVQFGSGPQEVPRLLRLEYQLRILGHYHSLGVTVAKVLADGPATRMTLLNTERTPARLEPGDLITHVDGRRITSKTDYYVAMYLAGQRGGEVLVRVRDVNTGMAVDLRTVAERVGGERLPRIRKDARQATKVKVLLVGDTDDESIGAGVAKNLNDMEDFVRGLPGFASEDLVILNGSAATASNVLRTITAMEIRPSETFFCYVACHGAYDERLGSGDPAGGHFVQLGANLMRKTLLGALEERGAQLTVLISDTCNVSVHEPPRAQGTVPRAVISKAFEQLLMRHTGVIDISGSSRGQYGWYNSVSGGCFTGGLLATLRTWDPDKPAQWRELLPEVSDLVSERYLAMKDAHLRSPSNGASEDQEMRELLRNQADQRPQAFQMEVEWIQ